MIFITGAKGYLGSHLCSHLDSKGYVYTSFSHKELDLTNQSKVINLIPEKSTIIHLAANLPKNDADYKKEKFNQTNCKT